MKGGRKENTKAIAVMLVVCSGFATNQAYADNQVLAVTVPAHPEWCSTAKFEKAQFESPVAELGYSNRFRTDIERCV